MMEGRKIKIFFNDGSKVSWKEGVVTSLDEFSITLDGREVIPKSRIVRMEVMDNDE